MNHNERRKKIAGVKNSKKKNNQELVSNSSLLSYLAEPVIKTANKNSNPAQSSSGNVNPILEKPIKERKPRTKHPKSWKPGSEDQNYRALKPSRNFE